MLMEEEEGPKLSRAVQVREERGWYCTGVSISRQRRGESGERPPRARTDNTRAFSPSSARVSCRVSSRVHSTWMFPLSTTALLGFLPALPCSARTLFCSSFTFLVRLVLAPHHTTPHRNATNNNNNNHKALSLEGLDGTSYDDEEEDAVYEHHHHHHHHQQQQQRHSSRASASHLSRSRRGGGGIGSMGGSHS